VFFLLQPVDHTNSSVTLVNAYMSHTGVTAAVTVVTAVMNATAVSFLLQFKTDLCFIETVMKW